MLTFSIKRKVHKVAHLSQARAIWNAYRDASGKGYSEIGNGVTVHDLDTGRALARISYNGRMWDASGAELT